MIMFFYRKWYKLKRVSRLNGILYRIFLLIINLVVPTYYQFSKKSYGLNKEIRNDHIVISLTTFPPRIDKIWICIESLLRQTVKPDKIILWLADSQFTSLSQLPDRLLKLQQRGLEIKFCEDLKSHKKYFFTMKEFPKSIVVTVDDDVYYSENMLMNLYNRYLENPENVVCYRAHKIKLNENGALKEYSKWDITSKDFEGPSFLLLPTGVGGVLYPPNSLNPEVFNSDNFKKICFNADDLWLKTMSLLNNRKVVKVFPDSLVMFTIHGSQKESLAQQNVLMSKNNLQMIELIKFYELDFGKISRMENEEKNDSH